MIAVFAAMDAEVQPFLASARVTGSDQVAQFPVTHVEYEGLPAVICRTGIGACAADAAAAVLDRYSIRAVLSVGTAGGISPALHAGDLVICETVSVADAEPLNADAELLSAAQTAMGPQPVDASIGRSLTVDSVIWTEKRALGEATGHDIVEMESYWVGRAAADKGVPFLTVRVVSDEATEDMIDTPGLIARDGSVDYSVLASAVRERPELIRYFSLRAEQWRKATASMRRFAGLFLRPEVWAPLLAPPADSAARR